MIISDKNVRHEGTQVFAQPDYVSNSFEFLLNQRTDIQKKADEKRKINAARDSGDYSRADNGATLEDFIGMVKDIVTKTMKKDNVSFHSDEGVSYIFDSSFSIEHPMIFYTVIHRKPRKMEPKPKYREDAVDKNADGSIARKGAIYGQTFDCLIQFDITAGDYRTVSQVMDRFEEAMFKYTAFFKKNGVSEIFFDRQFTDPTLDPIRKKVSVRSLVYSVAIEKVLVVYDTDIVEITATD